MNTIRPYSPALHTPPRFKGTPKSAVSSTPAQPSALRKSVFPFVLASLLLPLGISGCMDPQLQQLQESYRVDSPQSEKQLAEAMDSPKEEIRSWAEERLSTKFATSSTGFRDSMILKALQAGGEKDEAWGVAELAKVLQTTPVPTKREILAVVMALHHSTQSTLKQAKELAADVADNPKVSEDIQNGINKLMARFPQSEVSTTSSSTLHYDWIDGEFHTVPTQEVQITRGDFGQGYLRAEEQLIKLLTEAESSQP